jgi:hypothetical protein
MHGCSNTLIRLLHAPAPRAAACIIRMRVRVASGAGAHCGWAVAAVPTFDEGGAAIWPRAPSAPARASTANHIAQRAMASRRQRRLWAAAPWFRLLTPSSPNCTLALARNAGPILVLDARLSACTPCMDWMPSYWCLSRQLGRIASHCARIDFSHCASWQVAGTWLRFVMASRALMFSNPAAPCEAAQPLFVFAASFGSSRTRSLPACCRCCNSLARSANGAAGSPLSAGGAAVGGRVAARARSRASARRRQLRRRRASTARRARNFVFRVRFAAQRGADDARLAADVALVEGCALALNLAPVRSRLTQTSNRPASTTWDSST